MQVRVGIIGCGGISRAHIQGYATSDAVIVGVTDSSTEAARKLSEETGSKVYADYADLIDNAHPEVISVCTPPVAHEQAVVYALEHGVHVLCEKPMAFDAAAARRMRDAAAKSKAILMPAFRHRFLPAIIELRDILTSGRIGDPVLFNNVFCGPAFGMEGKWFTNKAIAGGGCLLDTNSHSVDLFRFIIGEIVDQHAVTHRHFKTTDVEDAGILTVKAENGAVGSMESSFVAGAGAAYIDIIGTKGRAIYDYFEAEAVRFRLTEDQDWTTVQVTPSDGFAEEIAHFLGAAKGDHALTCTATDGLRVMEVIDAVY
jgi:predicted dehydrogenase